MPHPKQITSWITKTQDLAALVELQLEYSAEFNAIHLDAFWNQLKKIVTDPLTKRTLRETWANQLAPVCEQTARMLPDLEGRKVASIAYTFARTGLHSGPPLDEVWQALTEAASAKLDKMDLQALVNTAWALATAGRSAPAFTDALADEALGRLKEFNSQGLTNMAWAFATIGYPAPALFKALAAEASDRLNEFNAQGLSNTAWAFATAGYSAPALFDALAAEAAGRLDEFKAQDFANIAWAFATAGHASSPLFESLAEAAAKHLDSFKPQELSNLAWAFAKIGPEAPSLFDAIAIEAKIRLRLFSAQELIMIALAFASARHAAPTLFDQLAAEATGRLATFNAQDHSNFLWAFATAGYEKAKSAPALFEALAAGAAERLGDFSAQGLTNSAWAFAVLDVSSTSVLFESALLRFEPKYRSYSISCPPFSQMLLQRWALSSVSCTPCLRQHPTSWSPARSSRENSAVPISAGSISGHSGAKSAVLNGRRSQMQCFSVAALPLLVRRWCRLRCTGRSYGFFAGSSTQSRCLHGIKCRNPQYDGN